MSTPEKELDPISVDSSTSDRVRPTPPRSWRPLIMRLHFYAGIFIAPFILIATISGGLYAVAPTIEDVVYREYLHTDSTGPALPVSDQIRAAQQIRPDLTVSAVRPAPETGDTTRVLFTDPSLGESKRTAVFVDPATAQTMGELTVYGSSGALPLRTWISELHRHLHLGEPGRLYSELAASWLGVIALAGLYLWIERYRRVRARRPEKARLVTIDPASTGRARTVNWHGAGGMWIVAGLLFLSATGLTWSTYAGENVSTVRTALSWTTPTLTSSLAGDDSAHSSDHGDHGSAESEASPDVVTTSVGRIDGVLSVARANGVEGAVEASIPSDTETAFTIAEIRRPWAISTDRIAVNGATDEVVDVQRFADWPLAAKLTSWGIALHMGVLFGLANQLVLLGLAIVLVTVILRGYRMWFQRRSPRGESGMSRVGRPPLRGGVRRISPAAATALAVVAIALGWFAPLLGISLVAFLAVDLILGVRHRASVRTNSKESI